VDKDHIVFGMTLGTAAPPPDDDDDEEGAKKKVKPAYRNQVCAASFALFVLALMIRNLGILYCRRAEIVQNS
jgi:hypothetical protein